MEYRADGFNLRILDKLDRNGYLRIKATFTKPGVFSYPQRDGTIRRELRHPDEVLNQESINTLKLVPIFPMLDHLKTARSKQDPNDVANASGILGTTGENITVRADNNGLDGSLTIYDKATIQSVVANPEMEVSASYSLRKLDMTPGTYKGSPYDAKQIGITYGHVTLVEKGRAGSECQIRADQAEQLNNEERNMVKRKISAVVVGAGNNEFRADALEIEETPWSLLLLDRADKAVDALKTAHSRADKAEGQIISLKKISSEMETKLEDSMSKEQFRADVKESVVLLAKAKEIGLKVGDDYTVKSLKMDVCLKVNPDLDKARADSDDSFLDGVFSEINKSWKHSLSVQKTLKGLEDINVENTPKVNAEGYEAPMKP